MAYSCYLTAAQPWAYNLTLRSSVFSFVPLTTWSEWIPLKTVVVLSAWYTGSTKNRRLYFVTAKPYHSPLSSWSTIFHSKSWTTLEKNGTITLCLGPVGLIKVSVTVWAPYEAFWITEQSTDEQFLWPWKNLTRALHTQSTMSVKVCTHAHLACKTANEGKDTVCRWESPVA